MSHIFLGKSEFLEGSGGVCSVSYDTEQRLFFVQVHHEQTLLLEEFFNNKAALCDRLRIGEINPTELLSVIDQFVDIVSIGIEMWEDIPCLKVHTYLEKVEQKYIYKIHTQDPDSMEWEEVKKAFYSTDFKDGLNDVREHILECQERACELVLGRGSWNFFAR